MATNTRNLLLPLALGAVLTLAGCETMKTMDVSKLTDVGGTAMKAMSLSDGDIAAMSDQSCAAMDQKNQIAPANSKYTTRLNQVIRAMPTTVNGKTANYRVYMTPDVNAWAMANGCIRVYSGLMDLMTDNNDAEGLAGLPQWPVRAAGQACRLADVSLLPDADEHPARRATEVAAGERRLTEQPAQAHARRQPHLIQAQPVRQRAQ